MKRLILIALLVTGSAAVAMAGAPKKHVAQPETAVVSIFGFKYVMTRPGCDIRKNGTAWLDACAPDGMAAATGDSRRKGRNR